MRTILYICTQSQYDWDSFLPKDISSSTEINVSILPLQQGRRLSNIPTSQVSALETLDGTDDGSGTDAVISYQDFLEKIFLVDLALVV
jgi:hypothetical protein